MSWSHSRKRTKSPSADHHDLFIASLIIVLGLWLRTEALLRLPSFIDEVIHLDRAHDVLNGLVFSGNIRKWLYPVVLSLFQPTGPEGLWLGRVLSALASAVTMASCIALGKSLGSRRAGLLAGLFYVLLPLAFFHERQALADSLLAAFTAFSTVLILWIARRPRLWLALPLGILLALANLTKIAALPYLGLPIAGIILLSPRRALLKSILTTTLALIAAVILVALAYRTSILVEKHQRNPEAKASSIQLDALISASPYRVLQTNLQRLTASSGQSSGTLDLVGSLQDYAEVDWRYLGFPMLLLIAAGIIGNGTQGNSRGVLYLVIPGFVFAVVPLIATRPTGFLAARYLVSTGPPLVVLGALGFHRLLEWAGPRRSLTPLLGAAAALGLILGPSFSFAAQLMADPSQVPLVRWDREQYIDGKSGGSGSDELTWFLANRWREGDGQPLYVLSNGFRLRLASLLGPRAAFIEDFDSLGANPPQLFAQTIASGETVYVFDGREKAPMPENPLGAHLELIASSQSAKSPMFLYRVSGAEADLADAVFTASVPDAHDLTTDYAALADYLKQQPPANIVAVFPRSHAEMLHAFDAQSIAPTVWPLSLQGATAALDSVQPQADASLIDVILVDEAHLDPDRQMLLALQGRWFFVSETWVGLLHQMRFITGPAHPQFTPMGAVWEDAIHLNGVSILDLEPAAGGILRLALQWDTDVLVHDSFKAFVHVIDSDGTLWAQYDGIPGNGLLPMTGWSPGDPVIDRLAISLPDDLPPGTYDLVAGIYQPESGLRLHVTAGGGDYSQSILLGQVTIALHP